MCQNVHSFIHCAVFYFFDKHILRLWSKTLRGSEVAQSDFLTFFYVLNVQTVKRKKVALTVIGFQSENTQPPLMVYLHKGDEQ